MTIVIVSSPDARWVDPTAQILRKCGADVVLLEVLAVVGFLLLSERIAAVVVDGDSAPSDLASVRDKMIKISPTTHVMVVARDDSSTPEQLARRITRSVP